MAIYYNGHIVAPTLVIPHDIYDEVQNCSNGIVTLSETSTVYYMKPTADVNMSFVTDNLSRLDNEYVTFMLVLDFTDGLHTVTWPNTVEWGNITPTMTSNVKYMFSFTRPAGANAWIGNQMYSW